jgi:hypothetical protein
MKASRMQRKSGRDKDREAEVRQFWEDITRILSQ